MTESIVDKISNQLSPVYRKLQDFNVGKLIGTSIKILRIDMSIPDVMGETEETLISSIIDNVIIGHPYGTRVQIFEKYSEMTQEVNAGAIDIWEILPIKMQVLFSGDPNIQATSIKKGDLIIEILKNEHNKKLPLIMQVEKQFGSFYIKNMVGKEYELSLYRGILSGAVQNALDKFMEEN